MILPIGIIVNVLAVIIGGGLGAIIGGRLSDMFISKMNLALSTCSFGMGIYSISLMENMPAVVLAIVVGSAIGLACSLGIWIQRGARCMQRPISRVFGQPAALTEEEFLSLLVTAIVLFCASGTGIYGCLDLGMTGDNTILLAKSVLDLFTAMVFACSLGLVVSMISIPQLILFLALFAVAKLIVPMTTPTMINDFKACGGFILVATGFRVAGIRDFPIADMLPAMVLIMPLSALWTSCVIPLLG